MLICYSLLCSICFQEGAVYVVYIHKGKLIISNSQQCLNQ